MRVLVIICLLLIVGFELDAYASKAYPKHQTHKKRTTNVRRG